MSFAQQLEERGFNKGRQEGKRETAKNLLLAKVDRATIQRATSLTEEELDELACMANHAEHSFTDPFGGFSSAQK